MNNTRHAVLFFPDSPFPNTSIMWIEGKSFHKEELAYPCYSLRDLAEVAYKRYITHLWVMPSYGEFPSAKSSGDWSFSPYENRKKHMMGAVARKKGHQRKDLEIIFPQHTSWWGTDKAPGWIRDADPFDVLITIHYLETALGVPIGSSPGRAGFNYLKKIHSEWVEELPGVDLRACHFTKEVAADIIWDRPLLPDESQELYVHKFDKGAAYPYAGTQTDVGVGTPQHVDHGDDARHEKGHPQAVGVWRCFIKYNGYTYDPNMPTVWKEDKGSRKATEGWLMGPVIRLLRSQGHEVTIHEGWVFPERHDVLVKWGNDFWDIRQSFGVPGRWVSARGAMLAQRATKQIVNTTVGMTAFKDFDDDDEKTRPDIRLQVIARHRELTWHNINKIKTLYGVTPVIVYMDAVYYLSSEPDGRIAFPELVKREGKFGGYRWEGRVSMNVAQHTLTAKMGEADKLEQLNKIGWTK